MPLAYSRSARLHLHRALEIVQHRQQFADQVHGGELQVFGTVAFGAAAEVVEFGLLAQQPVVQIRLLRRSFSRSAVMV